MIYTFEIIEADQTVDEDFIAVIFEQVSEDAPKTVFDVATGNDVAKLRKWATDTFPSIVVGA